MKNIKIALIALLVATAVFFSVVSYCYVRAKEIEPMPWGMWVGAGKLSEEPTQYVEVPENVDDDTKKALENPNEWHYVGSHEGCWAYGHQGVPVKYKDEYYTLGILWRDGPPVSSLEQKVVDYSPIGFVILGATGTVLGVVWYKREKPVS